jgi:hypothetical protein
MRLPVAPAQTVAQRRALLIAAVLGRDVVAGVKWKAGIAAALGGGDVLVEEHTPTPNHLRVSIPFNDESGFAGFVAALVRDRAPANQQVQIIYSGGFIVGESLVGDDI